MKPSHLQVHRTESVVPRPGKVESGFTDDRLTGTGGAAFLAEAARRFGLLPRLAAAVSVKKRARGASDAETQWSLIASLAAGNGSLSDVDGRRWYSDAMVTQKRRIVAEEAGSRGPVTKRLSWGRRCRESAIGQGGG